ncbi:hypothetical protein Bpfe_021153 [Biomphalaria pfeifferi]|uniref:Uncharacterized protein n=1 Tax=Biomphalaria pfeifferi TaxID=112525 RepID=A0AAD8B7L9_BIOPF|nr:hypothetical protein Bpfe_021153 [Biomphalaria pfeifferi]
MTHVSSLTSIKPAVSRESSHPSSPRYKPVSYCPIKVGRAGLMVQNITLHQVQRNVSRETLVTNTASLNSNVN